MFKFVFYFEYNVQNMCFKDETNNNVRQTLIC